MSAAEELTLGQVNFESVQAAKDLFAQVSPLTTTGDILVYTTENDRLPIGTSGKFLKSDGTNPSWQSLSVSDVSGALSTTLADGKIFVGNGSNIATAVTPSGDVTITNAGVTAIGANKVVTAMILDSNVTLAKIANIADQTILGNNTGGSTAPVALTASQTRTILGLATSDNVVFNQVTAALVGNASTATTLQTARNINGVSFNGSADITVTAAAGTLTGTTLNATVVTTSITSTGTMTSGKISTGYKIGGVTMELGSDATGDIYYNNAGVLTRLAIGSPGDALVVSGSNVPSWVAGGAGLTGSGTAGKHAKWTSSSALGDSTLYDDGTNAYFGTTTASAEGRLLTIVSSGDNHMSLIRNNDNNSVAPRIYFYKSGGSYGSESDVADGEQIASLVAMGRSTTYQEIGRIQFEIDGTFTTTQRPPGRIKFQTGINNGAITTALTIDSSQRSIFNGSVAFKSDSFSNADKTISAGTTYLRQTGTMSAARTVTLPAVSGYPVGSILIIADESGTVTTANRIVVTRAGSDTINGATSTYIHVAYGKVFFISDGTSKWTAIGDAIDVQVFTASGTWNKPVGATYARVIAVGQGGGGGSGAKNSSLNWRNGGSGGAAGMLVTADFPISALGSTETVTVGTASNGGAAKSSNGAGNDGTDGAATTFGSWLRAKGGAKGLGGGIADGTPKAGGAMTLFLESGSTEPNRGGNGCAGSGSIDAGTAGGVSIFGGGGGGGGGGFTNGDVGTASSAGKDGAQAKPTPISGGTAGGVGSNGGTVTDEAAGVPFGGAGGGGGGRASGAGTAGSGSNGGKYGGGGGGGGASTGGNSGAGGNGGFGICIVISY